MVLRMRLGGEEAVMEAAEEKERLTAALILGTLWFSDIDALPMSRRPRSRCNQEALSCVTKTISSVAAKIITKICY